MKRFHQVLQGLHDWLEAVVSRLSFTDVVHSDETSSTCFRAITSSIGAACGALSDEAGSTGDSSRSEVMSSDEDVGVGRVNFFIFQIPNMRGDKKLRQDVRIVKIYLLI